jgi:hypothetical protein
MLTVLQKNAEENEKKIIQGSKQARLKFIVRVKTCNLRSSSVHAN